MDGLELTRDFIIYNKEKKCRYMWAIVLLNPIPDEPFNRRKSYILVERKYRFI